MRTAILPTIRTAFLSIYKNITLIFAVLRTVFFYLFLFSLYKMVDSKNNPNNYKTPKISIGPIIKEILRFVPDNLKTKKMCKIAVQRLLFVINYVPDQYETKKVCDNVIMKNGGILGFILDYYKDQKMSDKALDNYFHALRFVSDCYKVQKCVIKLLYFSFSI